MPVITDDILLEGVEYIFGSGSGTLGLAVERENSYYTWHGQESAEWTIEDVARVVNADEDRFEVYPESVFTCEISADGEEHNEGPIHC